MAGRADYDGALHLGYDQGRAMSPEAAGAWREALARRLPPRRPLTVVDLGAGTGRFTDLIAAAAGGLVLGVEPAEKMRNTAVSAHPHPAGRYLAGRAEELPLASNSADAVVMFFVLHHVVDVPAAAREIARVLRPGGRLLTAGSFTERLHPRTYHYYMPRSREVEADMFPRLDHVSVTFHEAGLVTVALDEVEIEVAATLSAYSERLAHRAISSLARLSENEISDGLARLEAGAAAETLPRPVRHAQDLLTLELNG